MVQPPQKMIRKPLPTCGMLHRNHPKSGIGSRVCSARCKEIPHDDIPEYDPFLSPELPFAGPDEPDHGPPMSARVWPTLHWFTR
ncbi:hypothetical protein SLS58_009190 [Diplodia intermedia]|uniref:Uncharacterized protein n=1 Tax=Diplodia intermedia TaxID=856260 RepID=A0ABR3TDN2_9PEZI